MSGRPSSPFQPMAAGLEGCWSSSGASSAKACWAGCKWREDADGLEFDLSQDLPGKRHVRTAKRQQLAMSILPGSLLDEAGQVVLWSCLLRVSFLLRRPPATMIVPLVPCWLLVARSSIRSDQLVRRLPTKASTATVRPAQGSLFLHIPMTWETPLRLLSMLCHLTGTVSELRAWVKGSFESSWLGF